MVFVVMFVGDVFFFIGLIYYGGGKNVSDVLRMGLMMLYDLVIFC